MAKLGREIDGLKTDSRDKDLRLQSLQSKVGYKVKEKFFFSLFFLFPLIQQVSVERMFRITNCDSLAQFL
jgi:hypothetical protein